MRKPCIRVNYTGGPADHTEEVVLIGTYPDETTRDREILRLARIAGRLDDAGAVPSPWTFDRAHADRSDADLWAPAHAVTRVTEGLTAHDELVVDPDRLLRLFVSPADVAYGWYDVIRDGQWVNVGPNPKVYEDVTRYAVSVLPADHPLRRHYEIHVERYRRTGDEWIVSYGAEIAHRDGVWFLGDPTDRHIFPLRHALALARRLAPDVSVTGEHTALEVLAMPTEGMR